MFRVNNKNISRSRTALENKDFKTAINYCNQELKSNKRNIEVYLIRGSAYNQLGKTDNAIGDFKTALQLDPSNLEILKKLFFSYTKIKNIEQSLITCNQIIQQYPSDNDELVFKEICKILMEQQKYQECLKLLNDIIKRSGEHHIYHHLKGLNHYHLYDYNNAIKHFKKAYKKDKNFKYLISLSQAYVQNNQGSKAFDELITFWGDKKSELTSKEKIEMIEEIADISVKNGEIEESINWYNELLFIYDNNEDKKQIELKKAHLYKMTMQYDKALDIYQTLIKVNNNSIQEFLYSADIYERKGMFQEAYEEYKKVLYLDPYHKEANIGLANILIMKHDYIKAQELVDNLYEYNRTDSAYIKSSINIFEKLYEADKHKRDTYRDKLYELLTDMIEAQPNELHYYEKMIHLYIEDNKVDEAENIIKEASQNINNPRIVLLQGYIASFNDFDTATSFYDNFTKNNGNINDIILFQAKFMHINKEYEESLELLKKILINNNDHLESLELVLENNLQLKDYEEASDNLEQLIQIDETNYEYFYKKAMILARSKNYEEAVEYFQRTIALNNYYIDAYYNLAIALSKLGDNKESLKYFKIVLYLNIHYNTNIFKKISKLL